MTPVEYEVVVEALDAPTSRGRGQWLAVREGPQIIPLPLGGTAYLNATGQLAGEGTVAEAGNSR
jgi:hypothetical protein